MIETISPNVPVSVMRQNGKSKQPRFSKVRPDAFFSSIFRLLNEDILSEPAYSADSTRRDTWLRKIWRKEPYLAGVVNSVVAIDKNRGWSMTGGRNQVRRFTNVLHRFHFAPDLRGWRQSFGGSSQAYYTTDLGSVTELGRDGRNGPLSELYFVDPARCKLTGDFKQPLEYRPSQGKPQLWQPSDYFRVTSLASTDETFNGLGFCAISRCLELAKIMIGIYQYDNEMLLNRAPRGLLLLKGITEQQWIDAMTARTAKLDGDEKAYYGAVHVLASTDPGGELEAQLVALSQLPAEFNQQIFTDLLMYGYALAFGYDPREFWPVSSGALGTATETETQHRKAGGKGGLDFVLGFQECLQDELPETIHYEFDERDQDGELAEAQLDLARVEPIVAMREAGLKDTGEGLIGRDEARVLLAEQGLIDPEWTVQQEDVEATDTEDVERALRSEEVQRAMYEFPDEPIVRYRWPQNRYDVIAKPRQVKQRFYSFGSKQMVRRQIDDELSAYQDRLNELGQAAAAGDIEESDFQDELTAITVAILVLALLRGMNPDEPDEAQRLLIEAALLVLEDDSPEAIESGMETLTDEDILSEALSADALAMLQEAIAYSEASSLTNDIYAGLYDDDAEGLLSRLGMWGLTAYGLWNAGKLFGNPDNHYVWRLGKTIEHCLDCARLNGQVHTGQEWIASGWRPQGSSLECGGRNCDCSLEPAEGPSKGNF